MWKKKKQPVDERIEKESNKLYAKMYYVMLVSIIVLLIIKAACKLPFYLYVLEILALLTMVIYVVANEASKGILFLKNKDESLQSIHEGILAKAYNLAFLEFVNGEFLLLFGLLIWAREYFFWVLSYMVIWVPTALIITIVSIKKGWLVWGTQKKEATGKKALAINTVKGSLFFGCFMYLFRVIAHGGFQIKDLVMIPVIAAMWGIPFYFMMVIMMKVAEKKADKDLKEKVENIEE